MTTDIQDYEMISSTSTETLNETISDLILQGYVLYGHPMTSQNSYKHPVYSQAMVKLKTTGKTQVKE